MNVLEKLEADYARALKRAHDDGLVITHEFMVEDTRVFHVSHPDAPDSYYTVRWRKGERMMRCNCEAGRRDILCKHRALARSQLLEEQGRWKTSTK